MRFWRLTVQGLVMVWASPYTLMGISVGAVGLLSGGAARRVGHVLEFHGGAVARFLHLLPNGHFVMAMTLGHTVLGKTAAALEVSREHELVHVRQFERWGPLFGPAYLAASAVQWLRGADPYRDNPFEVEAYDHDERQGRTS